MHFSDHVDHRDAPPLADEGEPRNAGAAPDVLEDRRLSGAAVSKQLSPDDVGEAAALFEGPRGWEQPVDGERPSRHGVEAALQVDDVVRTPESRGHPKTEG